jgi:succinate dehydrogenase/fumarate reductase cytochrome b subunit
MRHLNWDIGKGFSIPEMTASGRLVLVFALAMTIFTWAIVAHKFGGIW